MCTSETSASATGAIFGRRVRTTALTSWAVCTSHRPPSALRGARAAVLAFVLWFGEPRASVAGQGCIDYGEINQVVGSAYTIQSQRQQ
jgi:hypothetical protein